MFFILNISELNNEIYGYKSFKVGNYANSIMKSIEEQGFQNLNNINKEIKF